MPPGGLDKAAAIAYHYAAGEIQEPTGTAAKGATATFIVEHPKQVRTGHSLAELAVEDPAMDYSYIEAGWIVNPHQSPELFIFWWDQSVPKCYDQGCGYVESGHGIQPGTTLEPGTSITLAWEHRHEKWWLFVNGQRSGFYPDAQWGGAFTRTGFAQTFGEVAVNDQDPVCTDMGNGKDSSDPSAASITEVSFFKGSPAALVKDVDDPDFGYTMTVAGDASMRYGGPGTC